MTYPTEHGQYPHLFVVARIDAEPGLSVADAVSLVSAFHTEADADAEAARLNELNGHLGCDYAVLVTRLKGEPAR